MSIKVSIIGSSNIAYEHLKSLKEVGISITSVASSKNSISAKKFSKEFNLRYYSSVDQLINNFNDDGLIIACKQEYLLPVLKKSLKLNTKTLIEKPVANKSEKVISLLKNKNIMVGFNRRYYKSVNTLKDLINQDFNIKYFGSLVIPESLPSNKISKKHHLDELIGNGIHNIDLVNYLFGKVNIKNVIYEKSHLSRYSFTLYNSKCSIEVSSISNAIQNSQLDIFTDKYRFQLLPIEKLNIFDTLEVNEPTKNFPLRSFTPKLEKSITEKNFSFKPGFLSQSELFYKFINNTHQSTPPSIKDVYNSLLILDQLR